MGRRVANRHGVLHQLQMRIPVQGEGMNPFDKYHKQIEQQIGRRLLAIDLKSIDKLEQLSRWQRNTISRLMELRQIVLAALFIRRVCRPVHLADIKEYLDNKKYA